MTGRVRNRWQLRDIVLCVVLAVVFGFVYAMLLQAWRPLQLAMGPLGDLAQNVLIGGWIVVAPLALYIVRRPFAGIAAEIAAAFVEVVFLGSPVGPVLLLSGLVQGGGAELVFALTRYRRYGWGIFCLSGLAAAVATFCYDAVRFDWWGQDVVALRFALNLASGLILTGILARLVGDALLRTGVLDNYRIGRDELARTGPTRDP